MRRIICVASLLGLILGGLIVLAPFIPIWEDAFAFVLAVAGFLSPEIKQLFFDRRHARFLNRLIVQAEKYQKDSRLHYLSEARLEEELNAVGKEAEPVRKKGGEQDEGPRPPQGTKTRA